MSYLRQAHLRQTNKLVQKLPSGSIQHTDNILGPYNSVCIGPLALCQLMNANARQVQNVQHESIDERKNFGAPKDPRRVSNQFMPEFSTNQDLNRFIYNPLERNMQSLMIIDRICEKYENFLCSFSRFCLFDRINYSRSDMLRTNPDTFEKIVTLFTYTISLQISYCKPIGKIIS